MMYFFHYTSKNNCDAMTGNGKPWNCEARQPQKGLALYIEKHPKGFYLTVIQPAARSSEVGRKMGSGASWGTHVLVFDFDVAPSDFNRGKFPTVRGNNGDIRIKLIGQPLKFAATRSGAGDDTIPLDAGMCDWCGPVDECPSFANHENSISTLYKCSVASW